MFSIQFYINIIYFKLDFKIFKTVCAVFILFYITVINQIQIFQNKKNEN